MEAAQAALRGLLTSTDADMGLLRGSIDELRRVSSEIGSSVYGTGGSPQSDGDGSKKGKGGGQTIDADFTDSKE